MAKRTSPTVGKHDTPRTIFDDWADEGALKRIAKLAASKGFRLHRCVPITGGDTKDYWMIQRGFSMRFLETLEGLQDAVTSMDEYRPVKNSAAQERAIRKALSELNEGACHG